MRWEGCKAMRLQRLALAAFGATATFLLTGAGGAFAAANYQPQYNTTVNLSSPLGLPNLGTGALTMSVQQNLQNAVQGVAGTSLGYDFIMVDYNGTNVAAVDPFALYTD